MKHAIWEPARTGRPQGVDVGVDESSSMSERIELREGGSLTKAELAVRATNGYVRRLAYTASDGPVLKPRVWLAAQYFGGSSVSDAFGHIGPGNGGWHDLGAVVNTPLSGGEEADPAGSSYFRLTPHGGTPLAEVITEMCSKNEHFYKTAPRINGGLNPVVNMLVTDGEYDNVERLRDAADALKRLGTDVGPSVLMPIFIGSDPTFPLQAFPDSRDSLTSAFAKVLFDIASPVPPPIAKLAQAFGYSVNPNSRCLVYGASAEDLAVFLEIGSPVDDLAFAER